MKKYIVLIFIFIMVGFRPVYSQFIPFDNYTVKEELVRKRLPANYIFDIEQDHQGYLWLATQVGAIRYDGYNFLEITIEDGLPDNNVSDIFIDSKNRVWIATESGGIAYYMNNKLVVLNKESGLVSNYSSSILEDHDQNIWYFSFEGVSLIKEDTIINFNEHNGDLIGTIFSTKVTSDGTVWFSTFSSLYFYDDQLHKLQDPFLAGFTILDIAEDKPGSMWFSSEAGLIHISGENINIYNAENGLNSNTCISVTDLGPDTVIAITTTPGGIYRIINDKIDRAWIKGVEEFGLKKDILVDKRDRIWVSTLVDGILLIEDDELKHFNVENNLVNNLINKRFEDFNGNIWIATSNGLSKYGKMVFEIFRNGFMEDDNYIQSIVEIDQKIYMGTLSGLNILSDDKIVQWIDLTEPPYEATYRDVFSILEESPRVQWLGTYSGISRLVDNKARFVSWAETFPTEEDEIATDLVILRDKIYCGTTRGLITYDRNTFSLYTTEDGLIDNNIWSLAIDKNNNIWCATVNGLSIFDGIRFYNYTTEDGLPDNYCNDIVFDSLGNGWIATDKGVSIVTLHPDWSIQCQNIDSKNGLVSDVVFSILIDKQGYIWLGHNKGVDRLDPALMKFVHYGPLEGFLPVENTLGASTITSGDNLWFGTVKGAVKYIPENDIKNTDPPKVYIDSILLYNDSIDIAKYSNGTTDNGKLPVNISLPYNKNNLIFKYVGLHYTIIEKNRYTYILEGYDNNWSKVTNEISTPPYRKIPPGKYTFKVLAANCDGVWTSKPAELSFEIRPPFWQTWWFYSFEALTGIFLLFIFIRLRERKLRQDKIILKQKVKERTIEVEKQRDQIADQKKEITDSILYAERIQTAVLPKNEYIDSLLKEYFILFKPRDIVSGDFYWINGKDGKVIVVAADCTGHGVPGAFMSMLGVSILNELASSPEAISSDSILNILREHLTKTLRQTGKEEDAKDGMDLALSIIDYNKMTVQFSGAYNPLVHIRKGECDVYKGDKMPVGIHYGTMAPFSSQEIKLKKGDCLYMFSDGYADQFGGPDDKKFKTANLRELLTNIYYLPMAEQKSRLNETIENWKGITEQIDDILVIGIRV